MFEPTAGDDRSRWAGELSGGDAELAHLWAVSTLELQRLAGTDACFSQVQAMAEPGTYKVVVGFEEEPLGRECLRAAGELLAAACQDRSFDMRATLQRLQELGNEVRFGPSTGSIVRAALRPRHSDSSAQLG